MGAVRQWAFALCAVMVACGMAHMLLPKSNLEKMFRMVISIFFLCAVLSPVILGAPEIFFEAPALSQAEISERARRVEEVADRQTINMARKGLEETIAAKLSGRGIKVHDVTINIITNGQNAIELESAVIILDRGEQPRQMEITAELERELGCPVTLQFRD